jgi:DNA-binding Xre family transcriptional regulator
MTNRESARIALAILRHRFVADALAVALSQGLTIEQLQARLGWSKSRMDTFLAGKRIGFKTIAKVAAALDCEVKATLEERG